MYCMYSAILTDDTEPSSHPTIANQSYNYNKQHTCMHVNCDSPNSCRYHLRLHVTDDRPIYSGPSLSEGWEAEEVNLSLE